MMMSKLKKIIILTSVIVAITSCSDAQVASSNLSKAAEMFELERRIVFYNGINGEYILTIEGKCSVASSTSTLAVTCKVGRDKFYKHYLGLSDNVTFFSEQTASVNVDTYQYRVIFKPEAIIPNIDLETSFSN
jgi:hypothetical protein